MWICISSSSADRPQTCRHLHDIIKSSSWLVYLSELSKYGLSRLLYDDGPHSVLLERLHRYQAAWEKFQTQPCEPFVVGADCRTYELVGGTFSKSGGRDLMIAWLPTSPQDRPRVIHHEHLGIRLRDFAIDPTQDFVAMMELPTFVLLCPTILRF